MNLVALGTLASLGAGLATFVGALPVLLPIAITPQRQSLLLGLGGGVMLAATAFSLVLPGTEAAEQLGYSQAIAALIMVLGIGLGALFLELAHRYFPHEHVFKGVEGKSNLARIWLFVIAITLHNFPEGLAVGVSFGAGNLDNGLAIAIGMALQNLPEGLVVALALVGEGYSRPLALGVSLLTGLVEPIGGFVGASVVSVAQDILPWGMAFAAGAMLFVISDEIIPESHRKGSERQGALGVIVGFVIMMYLDITLG